MNWYLVQYADNSGMVYQWTQADNRLDAAAIVLIDRGSNDMLANESVSYGGVALNLGQTDSTPAFVLTDATGFSDLTCGRYLSNDACSLAV